MQGWTATTRHGVTRKRSTERLKHTGSLSRKILQLKGVCWFYTYYHLDHGAKENILWEENSRVYLYIDMLVTSRNGDRKFMQSIWITSRPPSSIRTSLETSLENKDLPREFSYTVKSTCRCLSFFGKFGVLCFLATLVLRFVLLPYYRRIISKLSDSLISVVKHLLLKQ